MVGSQPWCLGTSATKPLWESKAAHGVRHHQFMPSQNTNAARPQHCSACYSICAPTQCKSAALTAPSCARRVPIANAWRQQQNPAVLQHPPAVHMADPLRRPKHLPELVVSSVPSIGSVRRLDCICVLA